MSLATKRVQQTFTAAVCATFHHYCPNTAEPSDLTLLAPNLGPRMSYTQAARPPRRPYLSPSAAQYSGACNANAAPLRASRVAGSHESTRLSWYDCG